MENKIKNMKLKIIEYENKNVMFMIEIERLGIIVADLQRECEAYRIKSEEATREAEELRYKSENVEKEVEAFKKAIENDARNQLVYYKRKFNHDV